MGLTDDDVTEILRIIDESALDELRIETEGFFLHVRKGAGGDAPSLTAALPRAVKEGAPPPAPSPGASASIGASSAEAGSAAAGSPGAVAAVAGAGAVTGAEPPPPAPPAESSNGLVDIPSPMLGTFYRSESPGAAPFVDVGDRVEPDTTVCIIEVMKMMNSVPAGVSGTIAEICSENAQLVEYGQPLFRVTPGE